jgi:hypothetical protein
MIVRVVSCALVVVGTLAVTGCGNPATPVDAGPDLAPSSDDADNTPPDLATEPAPDLAISADLAPSPDLAPSADLTPLPPALLWFAATPDSKTVGDEAELRWKLRKPADAMLTCTLAYADDAGTELQLPDCPAEGASYHRYTTVGDYRPKLTVRTQDGALVGVLETILHVTRPFTVTIVAPQAGTAGHYGDFDVEARVTTSLPLTSVTARIESRTATLAYDHGANGDLDYKGKISAEYGLKNGLYSLVVTATDNAGHTASASVEIAIDDDDPTLIIRDPLDDTVATPSTDFDVACSDGVPGCKIDVSTQDDAILASGTEQLKQPVSLAAFAGQMVTLYIRVTNRAGRINQRTRRIYVEPSHALYNYLSAPGTIESVHDDYVLYFDRHDTGVYTKSYEPTQPVGLAWSPTQPFSPLSVPLRNEWYGGWQRLAYSVPLPNGALFIDVHNGNGGVMQWKQGDVIATQLTAPAGDLRSRGDYVAWSSWTAGSSRYQISTGQLTALPPSYSIDVSATGKIAYTSPIDSASCDTPHDVAQGNVFLDGKQLTTDTKYWNTDVVTDGEIVAYTKLDPCTHGYAVAMHDGTKEELLVDFGVFEHQPRRDQDYVVNGKFAAFIVPQKASTFEVWKRSPMGNRSKAIALNGTGELEGLGAGNRAIVVFVQHDVTGESRRYGVRTDDTVVAIGSGLGQARYASDNHWRGYFIVRIGRSEFLVNSVLY